MMEHLKFFAKVAVAIFVIYQVTPISNAITKNYTGI